VGAVVGLALFTWYDSVAMRIVVFSAAQSVLIGWAVVDIFGRGTGKATAGSVMAAGACAILLVINAARTVLAVFTIGGELSSVLLNPLQAALIFLLAVFGALICQFGFLLMTMDRLHTETAQLAGVDELTGAASRRRFSEAHMRECVRSSRSGRVFTILLIDIDRFKRINDVHGHVAGDAFLKLFARTVLSHLRSQDLFARLGGDEFCVLMPETNGAQGVMIANRLVQAVREQTLRRDGAIVATTISVGVAEWSSAVGRDPHALMELADRALYCAKEAGRNGVSTAPTPEARPGSAPEPLAA
jgi:diguanylate cyclase (GGDEF)-like protein